MAYGLSPLGGAAWQFFDNSGAPLSAGLLYTYDAGSVTPATTYTSSAATVANTNPMVLDTAGRVQTEIWLTVGSGYKFVLTSSTGVQIGTWDNIYTPGPATAAESVAFNAAIGMNNVLPNSMYTSTSTRSLTVATSYPSTSSQATAGTRTAVMVAYPRIFAKDMPATRMGVSLPFANNVTATYQWRWLVYTNDATTGAPGPSVVDTGTFYVTKASPANYQDYYYWKTINYTFKANTIYWFAFAFNGVDSQYVYKVLNSTSKVASFGANYADGLSSSAYDAMLLTVPTSVTTDPGSALLTTNPALVVSDLSGSNDLAPIFYLQL